MKLKLLEKRDEAKGTKSFFWEPEKPVSYLPGQYFYFTIPVLKYPDPKGATRHFTISSSPTEGNILRITTRIREESGFKKSLDELPIGAQINGEGPNGVFIYDEKEILTNIFIAGGIGIAPFRSMIKYVADNNLTTSIYLIYSNSEDDFVFRKELDEIVASHPNIKIQYVVTSTEGHLDQAKIKAILDIWHLEFDIPTFWLCGPPSMIDAMEKVLEEMGINTNHIRSEKFTGY